MENNEEIIKQQAQNIARTTQDFIVKQYSKTRVKSFFGKLGSSLGLVVTVLPFAGLLLALGGFAISKGNGNESILTLGLILSDLGNAVYANLGLFFMMAIIMGFTGNKAMAVYSSLIGYMAFIGFMLPFIRYQGTWSVDANSTNPLIGPSSFNLWFWKGLDVNTQLSNIFGLKQTMFIPTSIDHSQFARFSYEGIKTLNVGVLGGIALGFLYAWIFNKTKNMKLPNILSFFEGEKFTSVVLLFAAPILSALFIIVWPGVNWLLAKIGIGLTNLPYGIDTLLYEMILQALLPFQAHQAFIAPMWWTNAGGMLSDKEVEIVEAMIYRIATGHTAGIAQEINFYSDSITPWLQQMKSAGGVDIDATLRSMIVGGKSFSGQDIFNQLQSMSNFSQVFSSDQQENLKQSLIAYGSMDWSTVGDETISVQLMSIPRFDLRDTWSVNKKISRFLSGGFTQQLFFLPGAAIAMWSTLDKERRKQKFGLYFGAISSAVIFGVSEPIFFMFCYTCPLIYFTYLVPTAGVLGWTCEFLQTRLSSTFSRGTMDYVINGILPTFTKTSQGAEQTRLWVPIVVGSIAAIPACLLWRYQFIKYEFVAPGSLAAETGQGASKTRFDSIKTDYDEFLSFVGGVKNLKSVKQKNKESLEVEVLKSEDVIRANDFSKENVLKVEQNGNEFVFKFKPNNDYGYDWVKYVNDSIDLKHREIKYQIDMKHDKDKRILKLWKDKIEVNDKIDAKWQIKKDRINHSNDIKLLKYNHQLNLWYLNNYIYKDKMKLSYKISKKLIKANQISNFTVKQLNDAYKQEMNQLKINKQDIANENLNYKRSLKELKNEKKDKKTKSIKTK